MRTKSLLLMAAIAAVATAGAFAQGNVYSVNAVGYVNKAVLPGFNLIANPLNTGNNSIEAVFPSVPDGFTVFTYVNNSYQSSTYEGGEWSVPRTLAPGEGFFVFNNQSTAVTVTFVGEVPQGTLTNPLVAGFNLKSSIVPQAGQLDTVLQFPVQEGDAVFAYNKAAESFRGTVYEGGEWGDPAIATIDVAQGFFVVPQGGARNWTRNFSATN